MAVLVGIGIPVGVGHAPDPLAATQGAETLGFDFVSINDHLHGTAPRFETWTLLTWLAAGTSRISVLPRVLALPYRNPAVLAKMAESLDRLSGGRLILGLGSGAVEDEFRAFGLGTASPTERIEALAEALLILRGLWERPEFSLGGRHHSTHRARLAPLAERRIPVWLGMYRPRGLELVGRYADGWIPTAELAPPSAIPQLRAQVDAAAREAGRDPAQITSAYNLEVCLDGDADLPAHVLHGTPSAVMGRLEELVGLGFGAFNLNLVGAGVQRQLEALAAEVLPALHAKSA